MDKKKLAEFHALVEEYIKAEREQNNFVMGFLHDFEPGKNVMSKKMITLEDLKKIREMGNKVNDLEVKYNKMAN